ncbi:uncharacterized protein CcaverHIS019_0602760 [Cutaneotrichosporon cavernicola]|uniref:Carboxylesterase type B domain-containing protein n=1 Tax=Cutaneotrichosporon cavernicola TaxID=279322 RepID=A0AA48L8E7_9TREE|nr:uncharacterized protein CcaverHIS019_0602760 [Cutaneotrichosporon cavernicola]BEI93817.1 hypothetical protein CcaverHIS019_0602760 [Cutaneotrichosporon cavernicola]BEJ01593.1 hypothetical protein CcaverHIS631_0602750 [Cutaneotrichosporon cavernicola]BEJ09360.1 hypothetical protein CcaverHIS641_0602750 [Cutaneotrichosporon cavernicola]
MSSWCRILTVVATVLHLQEPACGAPGASPACVLTWSGQIIAGKLEDGVCKTTVRYGSAKRWEDSVAVTSQSGIHATELPPSCPQITANPTQGQSSSEDCLMATIYAPVGARQLPALIWLHGGSYSIGSASAPGLDGSELAKKGKIVVIFLQYRLNVLGLIPPQSAPSASDPNLQVRDVILGLKEIRKNLGWQVDTSKVTLGGQSTGASLIRGLLVAPGTQGLFQRMILQSDPFAYGMAPMAETNNFRGRIFSHPALGGVTGFADLQAASLENVMSAARAVFSEARVQVPDAPIGQPFRPTYDTPTIPKEPTAEIFNNAGGLSVSPANVPLLITSTADDGAASVPPNLLSYLFLEPLLKRLLGDSGTQVVLTWSAYNITNDSADKRPDVAKIITDAAFRCSAREAARKWAAAGGRVYVGEFREGVHYPFNDQCSFCTGKVCHMDDILPTFGQGGAFATMITDTWLTFIKNGEPDGWAPFASSNGVDGAGVKALGGDGVVPACQADFWGNAVKWHWQLTA